MLTSVNCDRRLDNKIKNGEETLTETLVVGNAYALSQFSSFTLQVNWFGFVLRLPTAYAEKAVWLKNI